MQTKNHLIQKLLVPCVALIGFAVSIVCFVARLQNAVSIRSFILVAFYYGFLLYNGVYGYQKPHGTWFATCS